MQYNTVYLGDNIGLLPKIHPESIQFIYIDPPFSTNQTFYTTDNRLAYIDTFTLEELIKYLVPRIQLCYNLLTDKGNFCLHGDARFIHYLKIECDKIFGIDNFRNEIIWCYDTSGRGKTRFQSKHDTILWYSKSSNYVFNPIKSEYKNNHMKVMKEKDGTFYYLKKDAKSNKLYKYKMDNNKILNDYWVDIPSVNSKCKERTIYPTQKPKALLKRFILALTNEGDIVLDPCCGSGTTVVVAKEYNRKYIGFDQSETAIEVTTNRLNETPITRQITDFMKKK